MPGPPRDSNWNLLSNHGKVLVCVARDPDVRVSDIAEMVGVKERAVQRILAELRRDGLVTATRSGRRNSYRINRSKPMALAEAPVGNLLAIVTAPPIGTSTIKHIELLALQPQLAMIVVITSTGGVTKRLIPSERLLDSGLIDWARSYLNEELGGMSVGARMVLSKLADPSLGPAERGFL